MPTSDLTPYALTDDNDVLKLCDTADVKEKLLWKSFRVRFRDKLTKY